MPDIHWQIGEGHERETITQTTPARRSRRSWIALFIVIVIGVGLGALYRSLPTPIPRPTPSPSPTVPPTPTRPAIPAKLYDVIDREAQALADGDLETVIALHAPQDEQAMQLQRDMFYTWGRPSDGRSLYTILDFNLRTPTRASVDIRQFRYRIWFRETRFYRLEKDRWLRADADVDFWSGQTETLDTPHFHARYAIEDRELVRPIVTQFEKAYPQICQDLGCVEAAANFSFTVKFESNSLGGVWLSRDGSEIGFSSPRVEGVFERNPPDVNASFWFRLINVAAVQRAYYGATTQWNGDAKGYVVFNNIINWAMQQQDQQPLAISSLITQLRDQKLAPLEKIWGKGYEISQADADLIYSEGALVVYYIAQEYGAQAMPKLLKALGTAQSFSDVIEQGLDVPFDEFDQKWQTWAKQNIFPQ